MLRPGNVERAIPGESWHRLFNPGLGNTLSDGNGGARVVEVDPRHQSGSL